MSSDDRHVALGTSATDVVGRLRLITIALTACMLVSVAVLMRSYNIQALADGALKPLAVLVVVLGGGALALRENGLSRAGLAAVGFVTVSVASAAGAALGMLVLRWGKPQADQMLFAADAAIGVDVVTMIDWTANVPVVAFGLRYLYSTSLPLFLLSVIALGLLGRSGAMWRACLMYVGTLFVTCLVSGFFPAKGAFVGVSETTRALLPENAGIYAFETFDLFYGGTPQFLSFATLNGLACFPSFHTAAALVVAQIWWPVRRWRPALTVWCALVITSTIPIGGHYLVDLFGGALLFAVWSALVDALARGKEREWYAPFQSRQASLS